MATLQKGDVVEMKAFHNPPALVKDVMVVVMLLLGHSDKDSKNWSKTRKVLGDSRFLEMITNLDGSKIPQENVQKAKTLLNDLEPARVKCVSKAASALCVWAKTVVS